MKILKLLLSISLLIPAISIGQKIDNMASFRDIKSNNYFRFHYDNDYFTSTDKDYTQGYNFELVAPELIKNPINYLFIKPKKSEKKYGIALEHIGFTANNIASDQIQFGDRPFAAVIMLKSFSIATDTINKSRIVSSLNLGIIGPGAFGGDMQTAIHQATGNTIPLGWYNQIKNDAVVNYEISYEKQLLRFHDFFTVQTNATLRLGTLFTNASVGFNATLGIINSPFTSVRDKNKFQLYCYSQPMINAIGYDATLQGGFFNKKSVYTIPANEMERFTLQNNFGIVLQYRWLFLEYSRSLLTREFSSGSSHKWGGIRIGFKL
ncbi:lipid A deacylase LpxR family protein [Flavobacterium wongokense]|uniref:lipid A deacylase LpxR family protein n=1 Tax=Flavobacterium wongokense TaxID=2910674 RepID=UPI001F41FA19|nr:lipid A deacylase LpxR family protein [Flavobacterium sp. WG47]MCF6132586.1 lipid A deacylase LpxR family protein [Flavobacterium sp. WG47]